MNFVILAAKRTGSTMVVSFLDKQPDISCESEIFRVVGINWPYGKKEWVTKWIEKYKRKSLAVRYKKPAEFLTFIKENQTDKTKTLLGFKMFSRNFFNKKFKFGKNILRLFKEKKTKVVILCRKNEFLRTLSEIRGELASQYVLFDEKERKQIEEPFYFDVKKYLKRQDSIKLTYERIKNLFERNKIEYKFFYYEDLTGKNKQKYFKDMTLFIGQAASKFVPFKDDIVNTKKQNTSSVKSQIKNYKEVAAALKNDKNFISAIFKK
jgi:LPS sulfotransferase NodH